MYSERMVSTLPLSSLNHMIFFRSPIRLGAIESYAIFFGKSVDLFEISKEDYEVLSNSKKLLFPKINNN